MFFYASSIALLVISVTMLARANDLRWRKGLHWKARLIGFALSGFAPVGIVCHEAYTGIGPSFYETVFRVGIMLVFITTPYLPPWWRWISGLDKSPQEPVEADDRRKPQ